MLRNVAFSSVGLLALSCVSMAAQPLQLVAEKSKIEFVGKKVDGKHTGGFKKFEADAMADFENPKNGSLTITIDATSLFADDPKLADHLKNPDFFDVRKHAKIVFKSNDVEANDHSVKMIGKLSMLGKDVELTVPCKFEHAESTITLNAEFKIDRTKWGMTYGEGKIEKEVDISAVLVFKL